jgi:hypothetical protein
VKHIHAGHANADRGRFLNFGRIGRMFFHRQEYHRHRKQEGSND